MSVGVSLVPQPPIYTRARDEGLATSCTIKLWNVARPIRSLSLKNKINKFKKIKNLN